MLKNERGALIVEASFVFPIMFFVLFFLIYMGNMFYMRSQVDALATEYAVRGAALCVDPFLSEIKKNGDNYTVPKEIRDVKPYHSWDKSNSQKQTLKVELLKELDALGVGYFYGMNLMDTSADFIYDQGLLTSTYTVDISYRIKFPIRFLGDEKPTILRIHSRATVPVTDTPEFISNVDMAMDFMESTGIMEKLKNFGEELSKFWKS